jgi:hypothetical protein
VRKKDKMVKAGGERYEIDVEKNVEYQSGTYNDVAADAGFDRGRSIHGGKGSQRVFRVCIQCGNYGKWGFILLGK